MTAAISRRDAIRLLAAQLPFALAACSKPTQEIVPYVVAPDEIVPGVPARYATVLPLSGYGRGVIVSSINGRPTKVEGNPHHPASHGSTDVFSEADVLTLYDPDRSQTPLIDGRAASSSAIESGLIDELAPFDRTAGLGFALLTNRLASPTFESQMKAILKRYPQARWFAYDPLDNLHATEGARLAFDGDLVAQPDLDRANTIISFDADFLGPGPQQIRLARAYADRRLSHPSMHLIAFEACPQQTGAKADERRACSPAQMLEILVSLANGLGAGLRAAVLTPQLATIAASLGKAVTGNTNTLLLAGRSISPEGHAIAHWINQQIHAPVNWFKRQGDADTPRPDTLSDFIAALETGSIKWLAALGCNPVYDGPAELDLRRRVGDELPLFHAGLYADETAALARWHMPLSHPLESWSDLRAADGACAICQPLIRPLYDSRSIHEVLGLFSGTGFTDGYSCVRDVWRNRGGSEESWWSSALAHGTVEGTADAPVDAPQIRLPSQVPPETEASLTLVVHPDPCVYDGSYANNAWLQELPKPLSKQVWGNSLGICEADAKRHELSSGDVVRLEVGGRHISIPVLVTKGHAEGVLTVALGLGRSKAGAIGNEVGANAYHLRHSDRWWSIGPARIAKLDYREEVLLAQHVVSSEQLDRETLRKRFPGRDEISAHKAPLHESLYPQRPRPPADHAWGMVIDTARCIGCNACMVACQSENNIPVVGPDEIEQGRQMHWLRVDVYDRGEADAPAYGFQPVPCMQCEKAPCEPVCPVAASVHDGEGLNLQVYNRCIGTRFCEANCPYKVRRFNFRAYADGQEYANLGAEAYRAQKNPDVTVRTRGVMEKCTYCIQRVSAARRDSERDDLPIPRDSVVTACQSACPTRAITFGDLADPGSKVAQIKGDARHYVLLEELDTRPRTTYLADVRSFKKSGSEEVGG